MLWAECSFAAAQAFAIAAGQDQPGGAPPEEVQQLLAALTVLDQRLAGISQPTPLHAAPSDELTRAAEEVRQPLRWLAERAAAWKPAMPGAGRQLTSAIRRYSEALEALPPDPAETQQLLRALAEDAAVKYEFCRAIGLAATVKAEVRTLRGQQEVPGWEVYYLPRFLTLSKTAKPDRFPRVSSPATEDLAPGNYVLWALDPATKATAEPVPARVGADRSLQLVIDLPLP